MVDIKKAKTESKSLTAQQVSLKTTVKTREFYDQIKNALPQGVISIKGVYGICSVWSGA